MVDFLGYLFKHPGAISWLVLMAFLVVYNFGYTGRDDTDSKTTRKRSGMTLYTDYGTGCQYIKAGLLSGLRPRLDENGNHICIGKED
jgi:hypothetical protein